MIEREERPKPRGRLWVIPRLANVGEVKVDVLGDQEGFAYLAELLEYVARLDLRAACVDRGDRYHVHLEPGGELDRLSCYTTITRADASGTGELPEMLGLEDQTPY